MARSVRRFVRLPARDERQFFDLNAAWVRECRRRWNWGVVANRDAIADFRPARPIFDSVRDDSVHAASPGESLVTGSFANFRFAEGLVDDCDHRPVFLSNVRRIFRGGEWNLDAGSDGPTRSARNTSGERHQDRKSTRLNSSHIPLSRMPSSA